MNHIDILPVILFGCAFVMVVIAAIALVRMKKDDMTEIKDGTDFENAERPFIDNP